jgi:predicted NACHT family NTPase
MSAVSNICFDNYLTSLVSKYERSQDFYTQTDATSPVDFRLMVQTVQEQKDRREGQESQEFEQEKQKIDRLPVLDICKHADGHVLLLGRPGSGKTTTLQKLLLDEAQKALGDRTTLIPVLVELRSWRTSVIALIQDFLGRIS